MAENIPNSSEDQSNLQEAESPQDSSKTEIRKESLLHAVYSSQLKSLEHKIGWLLSNNPATRDSDLILQMEYWREFEDEFNGFPVSEDEYLKLTKLTLVTRARAKIQNTYRLFQASEEVQEVRGTLEKAHKETARLKKSLIHRYTVFIDESGKTQNNLVVGGLWYLDGMETMKVYKLTQTIMEEFKYVGELKFSDINASTIEMYKRIVSEVRSQCPGISFKAVSVVRSGVGNINDGICKLMYLLLVKGVEHENQTGRAPLPRAISVCKDAEEIGRDKLLVAEVSEKLKQDAATTFGGNLIVELFRAESSEHNVHLQLADLFASSVGRTLNSTTTDRPKDEFGKFFLDEYRLRIDSPKEQVDDMAVNFTL